MAVYVGLDVGGTKFIVASADEQGQILKSVRRDTPDALDAGLALLHGMIREVVGKVQISGMGAAVGGPLNWRTGVVSPLHQPAWRDVPLKSMMEAAYNCPFYVDVDTNIAAIGEYYSLEPPPEKMLYLTMSTGMGGGFVVRGKTYRGIQGAHPEIAHQSIHFKCSYPDRVICECGVPDCLEGLISGNAIRRIYGKPAEELNAKEWDEVAFNLGQGLRNLAATYSPDVIVLGGGVAIGGGTAFLEAARQVMVDHLKIVPVPEVRFSIFGYETPLIGAITTARLIHQNQGQRSENIDWL